MASNSELAARRQAAVARGVASATGIFADMAENARLTDVEGRSYIDFVSGIGVVATGHRHPKVIAAVERQLARSRTRRSRSIRTNRTSSLRSD